MNAHTTLVAAAALSFATLSGVALGGYTIGGFHFGSQLQVDDEGDHPLVDAGQPSQPDSDAAPPPLTPVSDYHECTGCDAHAAHVHEWMPRYASYDGADREGAWRPKTASEEDGWVVDEYVSARNERHDAPAPDEDNDADTDDGRAPVTVQPAVALSDRAGVRLPPVALSGI